MSAGTAAESLLWSRLPPVTLLLGPLLDGRDLARRLARRHRYQPWQVAEFGALDAPSARLIVEVDYTARNGSRLVICPLDGASAHAQNTLLKTLEEPRARFILYASERPLPTIASRAEVYPVVSPPGAESPATTAQGEPQGKAAAAVSVALRAVSDHNPGALRRALRGWCEVEHLLLFAWAAMCATGRWEPPLAQPPGGSFAPAFGRRMLLALSEHGLARPRLAAQVVLGDLLAQ